MTVASLTVAQKYLLDKAHWVLKHLLRDEIDRFNTEEGLTGADAVQYPRTINTSNTIDMYGGNPSIDGFPVVNVFEASNNIVSMDFTETRDHDITLNIVGAEMCDTADIAWASNRARLLSALACSVLERYLKDPYVQLGTVVYAIYRTDVISGAAGGVAPLKNNMLMAAFSCQLRVKMRSAYADGRTLMTTDTLTPQFNPLPYVQSNFTPQDLWVQLDSQVAVQIIPPEDTTNFTFTAGELALANLTILEPQGIADGAVAYVTDQNSYTAFKGTVTGGVVNVPTGILAPVNGRTWTVDIIEPTTKVLCSYTIKFVQLP